MSSVRSIQTKLYTIFYLHNTGTAFWYFLRGTMRIVDPARVAGWFRPPGLFSQSSFGMGPNGKFALLDKTLYKPYLMHVHPQTSSSTTSRPTPGVS